MTGRSVLWFASGTFYGGVLEELWHVHRDPGYSPELGLGVAAAGMAAFAIWWALVMLAYAVLTQRLSATDAVYSHVIAGMLGLLFWFIVVPLDDFLRGDLGLPGGVWWLETALVCVVSFELLRLMQWLLRRHAPR